ncbi:MAG: HDIG domain-containing metalloprotein [Gemmatimonadota bacterium]
MRASSTSRTLREVTTLERLSGAPGTGWSARLTHHGTRALLLLAVAVAVTVFIPQPRGQRVGTYQMGMVAGEDVIASMDFAVHKNTEELERERAAAAATVPPTFRFDPQAAPRMARAIEGFFASVAAVERANNPVDALDRILDDHGLAVSESQRGLLREAATRELLEVTALRAANEILPLGVLDESGPIQPGTPGIVIREISGVERIEAQDAVLTSREFFEQAAQLLPTGSSPEVSELLRLTLIRFMDATLRYDATATEMERNDARQAVSTVKVTVLRGEAVVRANQQVGASELERLRAYEEALRTEGGLEDRALDFGGVVAGVILNFVLLGVFGFLTFLYGHDVYRNFRWLILLGFLVVAFAGAAGIVARNDALPPESLPIAFVALAVAVLWDGRLALILVGTLAALIGAQAPFRDVHAWLPVFVAGSAAALSVRAVRRRAQTWIFAAIIAAAYVAVILTLGVLTARGLPSLVTSLSWTTGNALVSAILAMGFLPVFEWFTRITTDQTLLEWADPNRPLLRKLSMEAPGTYAHTISVANLAEAAANAIGANGLLCRVGLYYHDVGKMLKPQYFIENQPSGRNPHDKLKPATSAAIVMEHVTEGVRMAEEAGLPDVLVDFIPEHHGTQEISYFYERAKQEAEAEGEDPPDREAYRYPGPKPQRKETAISMLADSVESAARVLQDPTPERVRDLVESIVDDKIRQGQLDESPLTLREIGKIKDQFHKVMMSVYHHRIDYPATRHLTESPSAASPSSPVQKGGEAGTEVEGSEEGN